MFAPQACDPKTGRKNRSPFWAIVAPALFIPLPQKTNSEAKSSGFFPLVSPSLFCGNFWLSNLE
jgi:hypothetical protein